MKPFRGGDRHVCLHAELTEIGQRINTRSKTCFKVRFMARDKRNRDADEFVGIVLHKRATTEERHVRHRIRTHRKINRTNDGKPRIKRQLHIRRSVRFDVKVGNELRKVHLHVPVEFLLEYAVCPVGRGNREPRKRRVKHAVDALDVPTYEGFDFR